MCNYTIVYIVKHGLGRPEMRKIGPRAPACWAGGGRPERGGPRGAAGGARDSNEDGPDGAR